MVNYNYLTKLSDVLRKGIDRNSLADALSVTQLVSKQWLVEELSKIPDIYNKKIVIIGGWFGALLIPLLNQHISPSHIVLNDKDPDTLYFARILHGDKNIVYESYDVEKNASRLYTTSPNVIINTSCEHMNDMSTFIDSKYKCLYALQSCDSKYDPGHVNTKKSLDDFIISTGVPNILFYGTNNLGHKKRHMVIGYT